MAELQNLRAEAASKSAQLQSQLERVSTERDQLQQMVASRPVEREKAQAETQEKAMSSTAEAEDVDKLKQSIVKLEAELHDAKIKVAKSLRQTKLLKAELAKLKEQQQQQQQKKMDDYFDFAVEEELRKQVQNKLNNN